MSDPSEVTRLLARSREGDQRAMDQLLPLVYEELRTRARWARREHRQYDTLNTTAIVHEAFEKLAETPGISIEDRAHFFRLAAKMMRGILVDYARAQRADKRGGKTVTLSLDDVGDIPEVRSDEIISVDTALNQLSIIDERQAEIAQLRYFSGLTIAETADALKLSPATIKREWTIARAWLFRALKEAS